VLDHAVAVGERLGQLDLVARVTQRTAPGAQVRLHLVGQREQVAGDPDIAVPVQNALVGRRNGGVQDVSEVLQRQGGQAGDDLRGGGRRDQRPHQPQGGQAQREGAAGLV
jgi:hypothetical protein